MSLSKKKKKKTKPFINLSTNISKDLQSVRYDLRIAKELNSELFKFLLSVKNIDI